jgi:hypothetical protein
VQLWLPCGLLLLAVSAGGVIVVDLPAARWVEKKGYCRLSLVFKVGVGVFFFVVAYAGRFSF